MTVDQRRIADLLLRIERLERFILKDSGAGDWDAIGESSLTDSIRETINQDFYVTVSAELGKNYHE